MVATKPDRFDALARRYTLPMAWLRPYLAQWLRASNARTLDLAKPAYQAFEDAVIAEANSHPYRLRLPADPVEALAIQEAFVARVIARARGEDVPVLPHEDEPLDGWLSHITGLTDATFEKMAKDAEEEMKNSRKNKKKEAVDA